MYTVFVFLCNIGMHKELEKIERNAAKIAKHPKMPTLAATGLQKDIKVINK